MPFISTIRSRSGLVPLVILVCSGTHAQTLDDSPYSAYGFGDLIGNTQVSQAMMGGVSAASLDPFSVTTLQPATYAGLFRPTFEMGGLGRRVTLSSDDGSQVRSSARFLGFSLGIPFGNGRWGLAIGLTPYSDVGFEITDKAVLTDGQDVQLKYLGSGGLNRAFAGVGWAVWQERDSLGNGKRLSIGANFNYLFGGIERTRKVVYPSGQNYLNSKAFSSLVMHDPTYDIGVQFQGSLLHRGSLDDPLWRYVAGVFIQPPAGIGARRTELLTNYILGSSGVEFTLDTATYSEGVRGTVHVPLAWGLGAGIVGPAWTVSAEMRQRDWSRSSIDVEGYEQPAPLGNSIYLGLGTSWTPAGGRAGSFLERTTYRLGFLYQQDYLIVHDKQLQEIGMSFGLSLPVMNSVTRSQFHLGAQLGQRGTQENGAIDERYIALYVGVTITPDLREKWFKKTRIE
ncbi:MAG: hypothetical protein H6597_02555 [Flavobacteriales bacterium]|nr:hypothetical protein [Flavobacteriales bacterium]MCB9193388.1 hypothetical protein [Flavobacteriales bacterium]